VSAQEPKPRGLLQLFEDLLEAVRDLEDVVDEVDTARKDVVEGLAAIDRRLVIEFKTIREDLDARLAALEKILTDQGVRIR